MRFDIDKQTINDLDLFEKVKGDKSVFSLFNYTKSFGGKKLLESVFYNPLSDIESIEKRIEVVKYFQGLTLDFDIDKDCLDFIEYYLIQQNGPNRFSIFNSFLKAFFYKLKPENEYYIIQRGIQFVIVLINDIYEYSTNYQQDNAS